MSRITTYCVAPLLAAAFLFAGDTPSADAGGFSFSIGSSGFGYGGYSYPSYRYGSNYGYYNNGHRPFGPIVYPSHSSRYHSGYRGGYTQPHYDYHPPTLVPHRGHYHYQPGHYDLHYGHH